MTETCPSLLPCLLHVGRRQARILEEAEKKPGESERGKNKTKKRKVGLPLPDVYFTPGAASGAVVDGSVRAPGRKRHSDKVKGSPERGLCENRRAPPFLALLPLLITSRDSLCAGEGAGGRSSSRSPRPDRVLCVWPQVAVSGERGSLPPSFPGSDVGPSPRSPPARPSPSQNSDSVFSFPELRPDPGSVPGSQHRSGRCSPDSNPSACVVPPTAPSSLVL